MPIAGIIAKIRPEFFDEILRIASGLEGFKHFETKEVETEEGTKQIKLLTSIDKIIRDDCGIKIVISIDEAVPLTHRDGVNWGKMTKYLKVRIFDNKFVLFYAPRTELSLLIRTLEDHVFGKKQIFDGCSIPPEELKKLAEDPKSIEIRASRFRDFKLSSVRTGTLYGFHLEETREFADFKKRAIIRGLMVKMSTAYGLLTTLITEDCTFVLYSKVDSDRAEEIFEGIVSSVILPLIR